MKQHVWSSYQETTHHGPVLNLNTGMADSAALSSPPQLVLCLVISVAVPDPSCMVPRHTVVDVATSSSIPPELPQAYPPFVDVTAADNLMSLFACCLPMSVIILISNGKLNLKQIISWLILMHCTNKHPYKQKWKATANYELNMWAGTMILILKTTTIRF